jgi:endo-1,4-beta-xylanase
MQFRSLFRVVVQFVTLAFLVASTSQSLREAANASGLLIGTAVRPSALLSEPAYAATVAREFNMVEPEDAMKWLTVRRESSAFDFRQADDIVNFALAHGMKIRGHCLVWDHDNPDWLQRGHYTTP